MEARKFASGDQVLLRLNSYTNNNPTDVYTVSRALPAMANVWQYRVKRASDGQERAVDEQQLANAAPRASGQRSPSETDKDVQRLRQARAFERARVAVERSDQDTH